MESSFKFVLPSPNFNKGTKDACKQRPHFLTPSGMSLLPREKPPPPMYGNRGATVPPRYLQHTVSGKECIAALPEKQYCEPCELEFQSLEDLKRHRGQHERCPVTGCQYKGHPSVMDRHINALHTSGLFEKFRKLSTPEEIAAWREERRKRFPTLANVLLKQKAREQRQKRGERLEASKNRFGRTNDRKRAQPYKQEVKNVSEKERTLMENTRGHKRSKRNRKNKRNRKTKNLEFKQKIESEEMNNEIVEDASEVTCGGIKMFRGTCQLKDYKHFNDNKNISTNNVLFKLVGMYGSDDDNEETEESNSEDIDNETTNDNFSVCEKNNCDNESKIEVNTGLPKSIDNIENDDIEKIFDNTKTTKSNERMVDIMDYNTDLKKSTMHTSPPAVSTNLTRHSICNETSLFVLNNINGQLLRHTEKNITNRTCTEDKTSSDEAPDELPIQRNKPVDQIKMECIPKSNLFEEPVAKRSKQAECLKPKQTIKRKYGLDYRKARLRKQNTMLEKLLESDIKHERNVLLQCVRYVCENNFFGAGQKNQERPA